MKKLICIVLVTAFILLIPLVAMQFTDEVAWDAADFVVIGALLISTGLLYELAAKLVPSTKYRIIIGIALLVLLILTWVELAVGIFS